MGEKFNIAIDGLCATGKDTITKILLYSLNHLPIENEPQWEVIDSSSMYRAISLFMQEHKSELNIKEIANLDPKTPFKSLNPLELENLVDCMEHISVDSVFLDKVICTYTKEEKIISETYLQNRLQEVLVGQYAAILGRIDPLRPLIVELEKQKAKDGYRIVPGRDSFTVAVQGIEGTTPLGLYVYADEQTRAERRLIQSNNNRENKTYEQIIKAIHDRDSLDLGREIAPLPPNPEKAREEGYKVIDTSNLCFYEMGVEAVNTTLSAMNIKVPLHNVEAVVKDACAHYNLN